MRRVVGQKKVGHSYRWVVGQKKVGQSYEKGGGSGEGRS